MIRLYAEFDTKADAEAWCEGMFRSYHPLGYGTHLSIVKVNARRGDDTVTKWVAYGSRAESCD
jgi:hypothetical protein